MKKIFLTAALIATLFTGCSNELIDAGDFPDNPANPSIDFTPMDFGVSEAITRGTQITKNDITEYGVSASIYPASNTFTTAGCGSYWFCDRIEAASGRSNHFWPGASYRVSFFAYAPYGNAALTVRSKDDLGYPIYSYTVPTAIANQVDFMTAKVTDRLASNTSSVSLSFEHRCSDIRFVVINNKAEDVTVNSISLYGVKYSGTYNGTSWSLNNTTNSKSQYTFTLAANSTATHGESTDITGTTNHFIILPQTISSGTEIFNFVIDSEEHPFSPDSNITFEEGKSYTFNVTIEDDEEIEISLTATIKDWVVETETDVIPAVNPTDTQTIIANWVFTPSDEDDSPTPQYPTSPNTGVNDWESE